MVSLVDIGPLTEKVHYRGVDIDVSGLTALTLFELLKDIPELRKVMAQKQLNEDDVSGLIAQFPQAVAKIIVASMGNSFDDPKEVAMAIAMTAGEQALFLSAIMRMTFPQGVQSFVDGLTALLPKVPAAPGWGQATKPQEPSQSASDTDTDSKTAGTTHPGS